MVINLFSLLLGLREGIPRSCGFGESMGSTALKEQRDFVRGLSVSKPLSPGLPNSEIFLSTDHQKSGVKDDSKIWILLC